MSYLDTPTDADRRDSVVQLYEAERARFGDVPNYARVFALRPTVYAAWAGLNTAIKVGMDTRRYELATLAAARQLRSTYCALAHGTLLRDRFYDAETLVRIAADHHDADLDRVDVAVMDLAVKVARDGTAVTATEARRTTRVRPGRRGDLPDRPRPAAGRAGRSATTRRRAGRRGRR